MPSELFYFPIEHDICFDGHHSKGSVQELWNTNHRLTTSSYLSKPTVEGDNWMITQQVAAYLIKKMTSCAKDLGAVPQDPTNELFQYYLTERAHRIPQTFLRPDGTIDDHAIVQIFQWRAAALSDAAYEARVKQKKPWTGLMIQLHELSRAYSEQILVTNFYNALSSHPTSSLSHPTPEVLRACFRLFSLYTLSQSSTSFLLTSSIVQSSLLQLPDTILNLMREVRPHAVKLVDAWSIPDWLLNSALGRYDGKVYEELFDMAHRRNPLNATTFNPDWRSDEVVLGSGDGARHLLAKL